MGRISTRKHKEKDMDETDILKERKERILAYMESEGYVPIKRRDMRAMLSVPQEDRENLRASSMS